MSASTPWKLLVALTCTLLDLTAPVQAQDALRSTLTVGFGDVVKIKQKAEAGDAKAQVTLADSLASHFRATVALAWYCKAAAQGNVEGEYRVGEMLLFGAPGIPSELKVEPNPTEGIRWTFMAATNFHPKACRNMAKALQQGLGTSTNPVEAYAWLKVYSETSVGSIVGRVEMNELALKLDTTALQQGQDLAEQFKAGRWRPPVRRAVPEDEPRLKLKGITFGRIPLAMISGKTLAAGESARISAKQGTLNVTCLKIEKDSVLVAVDGEDTPRLLRLLQGGE